MKSKAWGMEELMEYFRKHGNEFGNPEVIELKKPAAFDLRWNCEPPLALRWTWDDPFAVRIVPEEGSLLAVGLSGFDYGFHVELAQPANSWLYVSYRYVDYPGKVQKNTIVRCFTKEGEWMKEALESGQKYLAGLG